MSIEIESPRPLVHSLCSEPRCDPDEWIELVEAANDAKAAGTKKADALIEASRGKFGKKKTPGGRKSAKVEQASDEDAGVDSRANDGLSSDLKKMSPEERKQAIKDRVQARRKASKKDKEL